jgi:hypothetical protein
MSFPDLVLHDCPVAEGHVASASYSITNVESAGPMIVLSCCGGKIALDDEPGSNAAKPRKQRRQVSKVRMAALARHDCCPSPSFPD